MGEMEVLGLNTGFGSRAEDENGRRKRIEVVRSEFRIMISWND